MAKKSLGHVELEWVCPNCSTRNPGSQKTCLSCGMPQPEDVEFQQPAQEKLITDEARLEQAQAGPDIHCYYCGSRNPGNAANCSQCGADLSEGAKRDSGKVLGAHKDRPAAPIECPACGTSNAPDAPKCVQCGASLAAPPPPPPVPTKKPAKKASKAGLFGSIGVMGVLGIVGALCAVCAIAYFVLASQTEEIVGTVQGVSWERTIEVEGLAPVEYEAWRDEIPSEADRGLCRDEVRRTQDQPAPNSREVCGTPYTVDSGSGFGEVVQDCKYEVFEEFCKYTLDEWQVVDEVQLTGDDTNPRWPDLTLTRDKREGEREERYRCIFSTEDGRYTYGSSRPEVLEMCQIGSRWVLQVNTFNAVTDIEPAQ